MNLTMSRVQGRPQVKAQFRTRGTVLSEIVHRRNTEGQSIDHDLEPIASHELDLINSNEMSTLSRDSTDGSIVQAKQRREAKMSETDPVQQTRSRSTDYDYFPYSSQSSSTGGEAPCQHGSQNCSDSWRNKGYQFPASVLLIQVHKNQTVHELLSICGQIEVTEIEDVEDLRTAVDFIRRHRFKFDHGLMNSAVMLLNLEHYSKWTKEKVIDFVKTITEQLRMNFEETAVFSKFHQDDEHESADTLLLQMRYDVQFWLSNFCKKGLVQCADLASIELGSVSRLNSDTEAPLDPSFQFTFEGQASVDAKLNYCRRLGLGPGTKFIELKPVSRVGNEQQS